MPFAAREQHRSVADARVSTAHAFTGRMCAAARWHESMRADALFQDPLARKLAGREGMAAPMGDWIMVPRTSFGDDFLAEYYGKGCRQLVLLGAGMDARAFRLGLELLRVFEVDQQTTFDVKEPLLWGERLRVQSRVAVPTDFRHRRWAQNLLAAGFDPLIPTVWLLEGLLMYLSLDDTKDLMRAIGDLSAVGSAVFHDACSESFVASRIVVGGAPFISGSDEYGRLWAENAGFRHSYVRDISSISVDRVHRRLRIDDRSVPEATARRIAGRKVVLFVQAEK